VTERSDRLSRFGLNSSDSGTTPSGARRNANPGNARVERDAGRRLCSGRGRSSTAAHWL